MFGVQFNSTQPPFALDGVPAKERDDVGRALFDALATVLEEKKVRWNEISERNAEIHFPDFAFAERDISIGVLDQQWKDHLHTMDGLREGINLRGYAQVDPKREYAREGFALFNEMEERIDQHVMDRIFHFEPRDPQAEEAQAANPQVVSRHPALAGDGAKPGGSQGGALQNKRAGARVTKVGKNEPCPCGSGQKYKKCCGA
jgi:preprotein translocase subunit SecA